MTAFPSMSYLSDCNKNEMMYTNVTTSSKIEVWADDTMKVDSRYFSQQNYIIKA